MRTSHNLARRPASLLVLALGLSLSACGGIPSNRSLESIHQPVVYRTNYALDLMAGPDGLSPNEARRLAGWFEALDLRYGDKIAIDDPLASSATRASIEAVASRYGMLVGADAPVTQGAISAGTARVVVSRSRAEVPGCPDWSAKSDLNDVNGAGSNYGCATNGNLAVMVADPQHLIKGEVGNGETTVMSSNKAIETYRAADPTGTKGLKDNGTSSASSGSGK
ncbi:CpaD family pilus assembly protein [Parablastomonas sp. CN1-191]|uniref:CpaD family pilus assembly protein n=1 Tax=Parablastomonas sp. CN1-191 TaxID=3400908 RepID=UPI003BF91336